MARIAGTDSIGEPGEKTRLAVRIGEAVRAQRKAANLTLSQAAQLAGMSVSHLSNIENGQTLASLPVLARIATALRTSLAELTRDEDRLVIQTSRIPVEPGEAAKLSHPMLQLEVFAEALADAGSIEFSLPPGARDLFVFVLEGSVVVSIDAVVYELGPEDALDARTPHSASARALGPARLLWATAPAQQF
ncbi:helix-turn-helix domain-containing protein [Subtercola endophyticus]|uniref:helix-turn-helix domain-containing protein n=1 Tax=Subtercola endophyticus TaxID=2895559 RepID=UPI001E5177BE|nr:XRE family transcriptional regulator [Subtercola endophyticus]UFS58243.1 XRE family transcriptional regulator [Subtercola endophyticus]